MGWNGMERNGGAGHAQEESAGAQSEIVRSLARSAGRVQEEESAGAQIEVRSLALPPDAPGWFGTERQRGPCAGGVCGRAALVAGALRGAPCSPAVSFSAQGQCKRRRDGPLAATLLNWRVGGVLRRAIGQAVRQRGGRGSARGAAGQRAPSRRRSFATHQVALTHGRTGRVRTRLRKS